jgi:hypothetical protein
LKKTTLALVESNVTLVTYIGYTTPSLRYKAGVEPDVTNSVPLASLRLVK